ncbi:hypothetical protein PF002_g33466 [Phytophthora fragariae]|uniref:Uncharacterized protein n=1 Tax=Phytophthora fragariae TaxID=53985 RepID=A0A6A3VAD0_9STRA|nr:hypothetical protein PF002_g33466 [Phytophthora fragariae]
MCLTWPRRSCRIYPVTRHRLLSARADRVRRRKRLVPLVCRSGVAVSSTTAAESHIRPSARSDTLG